MTAAWWYGRGDRAKGPSEFWDELAGLADRGLIDVVYRAECPTENPIVESLRGRVVWPPQARPSLDDRLFGEGPGAAADAVVEDEQVLQRWLSSLSEEERADYERTLRALEAEADAIAAAAHMTPSAEVVQAPSVVSATQYVALHNGSITPWDLMRPLPQRPTASRRIGTEVHRLIEERSRGMASYAEEGELDQPGAISDPAIIEEMLARWDARFGDRTIARLPSGEPMIELPFVLRRNGTIIRGRIDAVYELDGGGLEVVDFKTGKIPVVTGESHQLELYAEALRALGLADEGDEVRLTYASLGEDEGAVAEGSS